MTREGIKVLTKASKKFSIPLEFTSSTGAAHATSRPERRSRRSRQTLRGFDAIYLGAIGHPDVKPGILEQGILLRLRFELDQYINLRPVALYPNVETPLADKGPRKSTS